MKFFNMEDDDQVVEIQLPEYVLSGYYYVGKPSMILINGPLVVIDKKNQIKAVVLFKGLVKELSMFGEGMNPNTKSNMNMV